MIHSILLIGQSNAAGRGYVDDVSPINNDNLLVLRNGRWWPMYQPVNPDRATAGVSFVESFADLYSKEHNVQVGIIPCADGGTCLEQWQVGGLLFDHACYMAELASRTSTISAVLWHQGEADCLPERYPVYEEKLNVILNAFREKLGLYDVPFVLGELGEYLVNFNQAHISENFMKVNKAIKNVANKNDMMGFVSAKGLKPNEDNLHFSAISQREFGVRYYNEFRKLENKNKIFLEKSTSISADRSDLEKL